MNRKLIGEGAIAKIYVENGVAYKVFPDKYPLDWILYEVDVQQKIVEKTHLLVPKMEFLKRVEK